MSGAEGDIAAALALLMRARDRIADGVARDPAWAAFRQLEQREATGQPVTSIDAAALRSRLEQRLDRLAADWRRLSGLEHAIAALAGPKDGHSEAGVDAIAGAPAVGAPSPAPNGSLSELAAAITAGAVVAASSGVRTGIDPDAARRDSARLDTPQPDAPEPDAAQSALSRIRTVSEIPDAEPRPAQPVAPKPAPSPAPDRELVPVRGTQPGCWPQLPDGIRHHLPSEVAAVIAAPSPAPVPADSVRSAPPFRTDGGDPVAAVPSDIDRLSLSPPAPLPPPAPPAPPAPHTTPERLSPVAISESRPRPVATTAPAPLLDMPGPLIDVEEAEVEIVLAPDADRRPRVVVRAQSRPVPADRPIAIPRMLRKSAVPDDADMIDIRDEASVEIVHLESKRDPPRRDG